MVADAAVWGCGVITTQHKSVCLSGDIYCLLRFDCFRGGRVVLMSKRRRACSMHPAAVHVQVRGIVVQSI